MKGDAIYGIIFFINSYTRNNGEEIVAGISNTRFFKKKYNGMLATCLLSYGLIILIRLIDSVIGGQLLGETAVSAIGIVGPFYTFLVFCSTFISQGLSTVFTQKIGEYKYEEAKKLSGMGLLINIILGIVLCIFTLTCQDVFLGFFNLSREIYALAKDYFTYLALLALIYPVYYTFYNLTLNDGDNRITSLADITSLTCNIVFSLILVKRMGIAGLALGTSLGTLFSFGVLLLHLLSKRNMIKFKISFNGRELIRIISIGLPITCFNLYAALLDIIINKAIILRFTDVYLPAYAVANLLQNFFVIMSGAVMAARPQICVYYGEKNSVCMKKAYNIVFKDTFVIGLVLTLLMAGGNTIIPKLYGITTPEVFRASQITCIMIGLSCIVSAYCYMYMNYYSYIGEHKIATFGGASFSFLCPIILAPGCAFIIGYDGIALGIALSSLATLLYYYVCVGIKHKDVKNIHERMMCLPKTDGEILDYNIEINSEEILQLRDKVGEDLKTRGIDDSLINSVELMIEDTYELIKAKNNTAKTILSECNVFITEEYIKLVIRDNGIVFDITNEDNEIKSLRCYVVARYLEKLEDKSYLITSSFNRNCFVFERAEMKNIE